MTPPPDSLTPDEIEQRQNPDGTVEPDDPDHDFADADRPLTPDEIEQRTSVPTDDEDQPLPDPDEPA